MFCLSSCRYFVIALLPVWVFLSDSDDSLDRYRSAAAEWRSDVEKLAQDNATARSSKAIVCLGSSSFRIWDTIEKDMSPFHMVRRAYGGAKYCDLAVHADDLIRDLEFQAAAIFVGNDITGKADDKSPEEIARLASKVIESIRKSRPQACIVIIAITPTPSRFAHWSKIREANASLERLVSKTSNAYFVRTEQSYLNAQGQPRDELFQTDRLHLNADGYKLWATILKQAFEDAKIAPKIR